MKKLTILFFLSFTNLITLGQINYTTENKTHELSPFKVSLSFLNFEQLFTPITAGIMVEGKIKDKLFYNAQLRQGYIRNFLISKNHLITKQNESKGTVFEAGVDFVFWDKIKPSKVKVVISSSYSGYNSITETFFRADCDVRKYWAVSGGIIEYTRTKYLNSDSVEYIISSKTNIKPTGENFTHFTQSTFGMYGGLMHRKIKKAIVKTDDGYNYRRFYSTKFYIQMLVSITKASDIIYKDETYKIDNLKQIPLGYRIGWQWDEMGVVTGFEFGKMPCINLNTPAKSSQIDKLFIHNPFFNYVRFTFHFTIYNGDKNYHMKQK